MVSKKVSYEVIDPLTTSLRKQKQEKKELLRRLSEEEEALKKALTKTKKTNQFLASMIQMGQRFLSETRTKVSEGTRSCVNFTRS